MTLNVVKTDYGGGDGGGWYERIIVTVRPRLCSFIDKIDLDDSCIDISKKKETFHQKIFFVFYAFP